MRKIKLLLLSVAVLIGVCYSVPKACASTIEQMVAAAKTPADHKAIASYYYGQAKTVEDDAAEHSRLAEQYIKESENSPSYYYRGDSDALHCEKISTLYNELGAEYQALASDHQELAEKLAASQH